MTGALTDAESGAPAGAPTGVLRRMARIRLPGSAPSGVVAGAAAAAALAPIYADGDAARPASWWFWATALAALLLVGVLIAARSGRRSRFAVVAVLGAAAAVPAIWLFVLDVRSGTPGGALAVLAGCALVAAGAMATAAILGLSERPSWRFVVAAVLTVALVTGAGLLAAPMVRALPEDSVTAASVPTPAVPQLPTRQAWQVPAPKARASFFFDGGVVAAGAGFVTALGYPGAPSPGLAGVDGATGKLRWTYDLGPSVPAGLAASPDGAYVLAVFDPHNGRSGPASRLVALDAMTGTPLWTRVVDHRTDNADLAPTATTLALRGDDLVPAGDRNALLGIDLATGDIRWRVRPPDGCRFSQSLAAATATAFLQSERCDDRTARLVALDQQTGTERWRYTTDVDAAAESPGVVPQNWGVMDQISTDPTGTLVKLHRIVSGLPHITDLLLRGSDGRVLTSVTLGDLWVNGPIAVITGGRSAGLLPPDTGRLQPMDLTDASECPQLLRTLTTGTALVRICRDDVASPETMLVQRAEPESEVTRIDLAARPQVMLAAPGALVTAVVTSENVTYTAYRDA